MSMVLCMLSSINCEFQELSLGKVWSKGRRSDVLQKWAHNNLKLFLTYAYQFGTSVDDRYINLVSYSYRNYVMAHQ